MTGVNTAGGSAGGATGPIADTQVSAPGSATYYTPTASTVRGHLAGLDTKVGSLSTGASAVMGTASASGAPATSLSAAETQVATVAITPRSTGSKILVVARLDLTKDTGSTPRTGTARLRRGTDNSGVALGQDAATKSQGVISIPYGPLTLVEIDSPATTSAVTYRLSALVDSGNSTASRYELQAVELMVGSFFPNDSNAIIAAGTATPEGTVTSAVGGLYLREAVGWYYKASGAGNTGWVLLPPPGFPATSASSFTPDGSTAPSFDYTLTAAATVGAPTSLSTGQLYAFRFTQGGSGGFTLAYDAAWKSGSATATVGATGNTTGKVCTDLFLATTATTAVRVGGTPAWA